MVYITLWFQCFWSSFLIIQTKKISAVKLKTLNWLRMSHPKKPCSTILVQFLSYCATKILRCQWPCALLWSMYYEIFSFFPIFLTVQKISRSLEEVRHLQCRKLGNLKFHAHQFLITRLSKCVVLYQYDTTWHMCQKNNMTQHNTDNTHKKYFFLRVIELEVFIQTYDNWFSSKIIYKLCGSIFRAFMTSPLIWINLLL